MSFDLSAVLKFVTRAILKLIQERLAKTAEPQPQPQPATLPVAPLEKAPVRPSDRVLAAVVDLKLGVRKESQALSDGALALSDQAMPIERQNRPASAETVVGNDLDRYRQAAIETQAAWRDRHLLATLARPSAETPTPSGSGQAPVTMRTSPATPVDTELAQAQTDFRSAVQAYRALMTA